jgi:hypothetical protein
VHDSVVECGVGEIIQLCRPEVAIASGYFGQPLSSTVAIDQLTTFLISVVRIIAVSSLREPCVQPTAARAQTLMKRNTHKC